MDNIVFHSGSGMPDSLILEGECSPFSLKYLCQQLGKFLEGTCWNLFVPLVPSLRGAFAIRGAQTRLLNWLFSFIFSSLMHHYSYRNKPKKKKKQSLHEVIIWLIRGAESISSSEDWILTTNLIQAAYMVRHERAKHQKSGLVQAFGCSLGLAFWVSTDIDLC